MAAKSPQMGHVMIAEESGEQQRPGPKPKSGKASSPLVALSNHPWDKSGAQQYRFCLYIVPFSTYIAPSGKLAVNNLVVLISRFTRYFTAYGRYIGFKWCLPSPRSPWLFQGRGILPKHLSKLQHRQPHGTPSIPCLQPVGLPLGGDVTLNVVRTFLEQGSNSRPSDSEVRVLHPLSQA